MTTVSPDKRQLVEISPNYAASEGGSEGDEDCPGVFRVIRSESTFWSKARSGSVPSGQLGEAFGSRLSKAKPSVVDRVFLEGYDVDLRVIGVRSLQATPRVQNPTILVRAQGAS